MSYIVLARRWRPGSFDELIGQKTISAILKNAISQQRIAHAYLFSGPRGVGKTSTARILAKSLNCIEGPTPEPCGICDSCRSITDGHSIDVMEIDGASNNSVDDIRDLRERVKYAPSAGRYKIYIIDEVHMLSQSAFNALLKTLEEPPPHVIFVLATTAPHKVPVTVLSRCQHLPFRRVPTEEMKGQVKRIAGKEGISISEDALQMLVRASDGSMRDALTLLDQLSAFSASITGSGVRDLLGIPDTEAVIGLTDAVLRGDRQGIIVIIDSLYDRGTDFRSFIRDVVEFARSLLVARISGIEEMAGVSGMEMEYMRKTAPSLSEEELILFLSEMIKTESEVRSAYSARVALEMGMIRASLLSRLKPVGEIMQRFQTSGDIDDKTTAPEGAGKGTVKEDEPGGPSATEKAQDGIPGGGKEETSIGDAWRRLMELIGDSETVLASKLGNATPSLDGDRLILTFNGGHTVLAESVKKNTVKLQDIIRSSGIGYFSNIKTVEIVKDKARLNNSKRQDVQLTPDEMKVIEKLGGRIIERRKTDV